MHPFTSRSFITVDRRKFLAGATALIAAGLLPRDVLALAQPHSFKQGSLDVTVVSDGHLMLPATIIAPNAPPEEVKAILDTIGVTDGKIQAQTNAALIKAGSELILFDTGSGAGFQPTSGNLTETLLANGIDPKSITKVVFTHAHPDHCWGTMGADGAFRFPNATHYVAATEWDFWTDESLPGKMPEAIRPMALNTQKTLGAMKDKVAMLKPGDEIAAGITVVDTAGHTPGHVSFEVPGDGGLIIMGDVINNPAVYFPHPEWTFAFDANSDMAIQTRKRVLDRAATDKVKLLGYHWPYPGLGHAEKSGTGYRYVPAA